MAEQTFSIAIDGPAASGKGTIARRLARHYGLRHLDTGLLYRAVASLALEREASATDGTAVARLAEELSATDLERDNLRAEAVGRLASVVAAHPQVRAALLDWQRNFAAGGAVLDGRDIGTVVLPGADAKLYVTASLEARAERRYAERAKTEAITLEAVRNDIRERDARDAGRADAPMAQAEDAALLDTSEMDIEQAFDEAKRLIEEQLDR